MVHLASSFSCTIFANLILIMDHVRSDFLFNISLTLPLSRPHCHCLQSSYCHFLNNNWNYHFRIPVFPFLITSLSPIKVTFQKQKSNHFNPPLEDFQWLQCTKSLAMVCRAYQGPTQPSPVLILILFVSLLRLSFL